jgi:GTP-binding protein
VVYRFTGKDEEIRINRERPGFYRVSGYRVEHLLEKLDIESETGMKYFSRQFTKMGIDRLLRDQGAVDGDTIAVADYEFEFVE